MKSISCFSSSTARPLGGAMLFLLSLTCPLHATALELPEAVRAGLAIHPEVRAVLADAERANTEIKIAKGGYYPSLNLSGGPEEFNFGDVVYDVTASQMLYDWGRVGSRVDRASAEHRHLSESALVARDDAALDIIETYLDTLLAERRVEVVRQHLVNLGDVLRMTEARGQDGYSDRSEVDRAGLEMTRAQEQLAMEKGSLQDARSQYLILVGQDADALSEPHPLSMQRYLSASDLKQVITASPLYQRAVQNTAQAEAELRETKASLLPQLNLEATALRREIGGQLENDSMIALRLRMDTIQGLSNFQRPTAAQQRVESAQWSQDAMQRDISRKLRNLFDTGDTLRWREESLRLQVSESDEVTTLYREQFEVGRRDVIDLLNVQRERFEAARQLETLRIERLRIEYRAAAQVGLLGALLENRLNGA